jgi:LacI family transcriptional regulator
MDGKDSYNVMAVYSLMPWSGRDIFAGTLEEISNKRNWRLHTTRPGRFFSKRELLDENGDEFDGFIISMPGTDSVMEEIAKSNIPTVLVNITDRRLAARTKAVSTVWLDNADVGRQAAKHLLEQGAYKSAGFVHDDGIPFYSTERMTAFRHEMRKNRLETSVFSDNGNLRAWLRELPKPAAVMASSDIRAADLIIACREAGITVPDQIAVIGVDNDVAQHKRCGMSISSVVVGLREMGATAVRELDFLFRHPNFAGRLRETLVPASRIFIGASSMRSATTYRVAEEALELIEKNKTQSISPTKIAGQLGCSRQFADRCLSAICGKTLSKAIEDVRMKEAQRRLQDGCSVGAIVKSMKFTSANQFYRIYKRHFGHTTKTGF